jgi:transposase-like protein
MEDLNIKKRPELEQTEFIDKMPKACTDELTAVELFESIRWGDTPHCVHCGSTNVYKMMNAATGTRSKRYLWRCRDCRKQYTVRIRAVYEESRIPMQHWAYAFWRASTSKKGAAALEIMRQCQISYKSALFLMHRIRFAMAPKPGTPAKFTGTVEVDETYCGGKPRPGTGPHKRGRGTKKTPVLGIVQRDGDVHRRVITDVSAKTLQQAVRQMVDEKSRIITDENPSYLGLDQDFAGGHETVNHSQGEYAYDDIHTNTAESSFALVKRGLMGIYHAVSKKHLHRYLAEFDFRWNGRKMNDGQRTIAAIRSAEGKRLTYRPLLKAS